MSPIQDPKWRDFLDGGSLRRLDATRFLTRCRNRAATRAEMSELVLQQYYYARHFTRYLCALLSNIAEDSDRMELTENLLEEIGYGSDGALPHAQIYRNMMGRMGLDPSRGTPRPETLALVDKMYAACRNPDPMIGLAALCLGAEAIVPHLYSQIVEGFLGLGESEENLEFFRLHIEGDDAHAVTMRRIIERELEKDPARATTLKRAAAEILEARAVFFEALSPNVRLAPRLTGGVSHAELHV